MGDTYLPGTSASDTDYVDEADILYNSNGSTSYGDYSNLTYETGSPTSVDASFWQSALDAGAEFADDFDLNSPYAKSIKNYFKNKDGSYNIEALTAGASGITSLAGMLGLIDMDSSDDRPVGYQGGIPDYTAVRAPVANTYDPNRRPGSSGQRYFSQMEYATPAQLPAAQAATQARAEELEPINLANPARQSRPATPMALRSGGIARLAGGGMMGGGMQPYNAPLSASRNTLPGMTNNSSANFNTLAPQMAPQTPQMSRQDLVRLYKSNPTAAYDAVMSGLGGPKQSMGYARSYLENLSKAYDAQQLPSQQQQMPRQPIVNKAMGGIASVQPKGYYLGGTTDGMADAVPAAIDNRQPAALSDGEFVVPADVVSHLGNGNSNAGAKQLYGMMDNIRQARTGNSNQGKQINPNKFIPA